MISHVLLLYLVSLEGQKALPEESFQKGLDSDCRSVSSIRPRYQAIGDFSARDLRPDFHFLVTRLNMLAPFARALMPAT